MAVDLDNTEDLSAVDPSGMLAVVEQFPAQVREALLIGESALDLPSADGLDSIVVLGMGGSGISGDIAASLLYCASPVPVFTVKGYSLPALVGPGSLVFAVSYSGNTEETLTCLDEALARGARVVAVASGGRLEDVAGDNGLPVFRIPAGLQPRACLGYLAVPLIAALERMGIVSGMVEMFSAAVGMLEERSLEYGAAAPLDGNPAKRLAKDLVGFMPVVYGSEGTSQVAAKRWKAQFNEMAKVPSFDNCFPELNHNETVGWQNLEEVCSRCHLVVLREPHENPRIARRIEITIDLLGDHLGHITQVCARGSNVVEHLLDLIYFGDFASVYLALALGQDPTPVTRIEELKKRLAEERR